MRCISIIIFSAAFALLTLNQVMAGTRLVHAVGRAAIANGDLAGARKSALAEALYDAAGQVRMSVRGSTMVSDAGALREESGIIVSGQLKGYQVLDERREGDHFVVTINALANTEEGECGSSKKSDVAIGAIDIRVAPGLTGRVERQGREGVERLFSVLNEEPSLRAVDDRRFNPVTRSAKAVKQNLGYLAIVENYRPTPGVLRLDGIVKLERTRMSNQFVTETAIDVTADLQIVDTMTGAVRERIVERAQVPLESRVWGTNILLPPNITGSFDDLWQEVAARVADHVGCDNVRAVVTSVSGNRATLSAGTSNGVKPGDYFLVELPSETKNSWQIIRVESAGANQSVARLMKPKPIIQANSIAVLLQ
ncbi:MAG: hypothetical protein FJX04_02045 [Alphaproteobacteria bacterium]|nr:hypothetical protein [Alphaproteobacteria bacterium]